MHWALSIVGKDEGDGGDKSKVFGTPGGKNQAKRGNQGKIFGRIFGRSVAIVLLAEAHVALRVPLGHADMIHL